MIDALGKLLIELRDDAPFAAWHGDRVRGEEPAPPTRTYDGDARGAAEYIRFVVITTLATPRDRRVPIQRPTYAINIFGLDPKDAMAGYVLASDAIHRAGVRMEGTGNNRLGIWNSFDDSGATPAKDPETGQAFVTFVVYLIATDQSVAA
jgi:hypothetical protein